MVTSAIFKVLAGCLAAVVGFLSYVEINDDVLLANKSAVLSPSRIAVFKYLSDLRNIPGLLWQYFAFTLRYMHEPYRISAYA